MRKKVFDLAKYPKYYVRPDGLHETILRVNGKRKAFRGKTDKEVWEKVKAFDRSKAEAQAAAPVTFAQIADAWWSEIEPSLAANSLKNYRPALQRAVAQFGRRPAAEITAKEIDHYICDFASTRARKTVATQLQIIRQIFRWGKVHGAIPDNPARDVQPPRNLPRKRRAAPAPDEIIRIKQSADLPFGLFALLVYYTGCRRGEALALTGADIDRENNLIHITKSVYYVGNAPHIKSPKTEAGTRSVPLLPALEKALPSKLGKSAYLFAEPNGDLLTNSHFTACYDDYRAASGVTVTPHQIRHGYATALLESGVDPKTAQVLLGHSQMSTTMDIYTHVREDQIRAAAQKMEKGF